MAQDRSSRTPKTGEGATPVRSEASDAGPVERRERDGLALLTAAKWDGRDFLHAAFGAPLSDALGLGPLPAAGGAPVFPRPMMSSWTVDSFAGGLPTHNRCVPPAFLQALKAERARDDAEPDGEDRERQCALFFAWTSVRVIAPFLLRRAGYEDFARECEAQTDLRAAASVAGRACQTITREHRGALVRPRGVTRAYGGCSHASDAAYKALHEDLDVVRRTGDNCARALSKALMGPDHETEADRLVWQAAGTIMVAALSLRPAIGPELRPAAARSKSLGRPPAASRRNAGPPATQDDPLERMPDPDLRKRRDSMVLAIQHEGKRHVITSLDDPLLTPEVRAQLAANPAAVWLIERARRAEEERRREQAAEKGGD